MIVALALSPSLDATYEVDVLRPGDITRPHRVTKVPGGKALNMVRAAAALGAEVRVVVALGGLNGQWIAGALDAERVPATVVPLTRETRSCLAIVERAEAVTSTDLYEAATAFEPAEWAAFERTVRAEVAHGDPGCRPAWVAVSGSVPPGVAPVELAHLLTEVRATGIRVAVDASGAGLAALVQLADLVKINRHEAGELLGGDPSAEDACRLLRDRYGVDAVVTDGVSGAAALIGDHHGDVPRPAVHGRFPAGSGDAFLGGLLAALDRRADAAAALRSAVDAATRNALIPGQGRLADRIV